MGQQRRGVARDGGTAGRVVCIPSKERLDSNPMKIRAFD